MDERTIKKSEKKRIRALMLARYFRSLLVDLGRARKHKKAQAKPFSRKRDCSRPFGLWQIDKSEVLIRAEPMPEPFERTYRSMKVLPDRESQAEAIAAIFARLERKIGVYATLSDTEKAAHIQGSWNHKTEKMKSRWGFVTKVVVTLIGAAAACYVATTQLSASTAAARVQQCVSGVVNEAVSKAKQVLSWLKRLCTLQHGNLAKI